MNAGLVVCVLHANRQENWSFPLLGNSDGWGGGG